MFQYDRGRRYRQVDSNAHGCCRSSCRSTIGTSECSGQATGWVSLECCTGCRARQPAWPGRCAGCGRKETKNSPCVSETVELCSFELSRAVPRVRIAVLFRLDRRKFKKIVVGVPSQCQHCQNADTLSPFPIETPTKWEEVQQIAVSAMGRRDHPPSSGAGQFSEDCPSLRPDAGEEAWSSRRCTDYKGTAPTLHRGVSLHRIRAEPTPR